MKRLLLTIACITAVSCADSIFAPMPAVSAPGAALLDYAGQSFDAGATFEGPMLFIASSSGEYLLTLNVADLRGGRPRLGRHRIKTETSDGTEFRFYQRYLVIEPIPPIPGMTSPENVMHDLGYRAREGFLEITSSSAQEIRGVLYLRADAGYGSGEFTIRTSFFARPVPDADDDRRIHIPPISHPIPRP